MSTRRLPSLTLVTVLMAGSAFAAPAPLDLGPTESQLDRFELLDLSISKGWATYRVIGHGTYADEHGPRSSVKCRYPGMKKHPTSGVVIRAWDLNAGKVGEAWTVYAIAEKAAECSPKETNEKNLAAAKAAVAALGLEFDRKPSLVRARRGRITLKVGDKKVPVKIRVEPRATVDEEAMKARATVQLTLGKRVLFEGSHEFSTMGAATCEIRVLGAAVEGDKVVFALSVTTGDMRLAPTTRVAFTKPISLAD